jgi:S1-C subfamily serine protease
MMNEQDLLSRFSDELAARAKQAAAQVASLRVRGERHVSVTSWRADVLVASEQALPEGDEFEAVLPGGGVIKARVAGRDEGTNVAALRIEAQGAFASAESASAQVGSIALAYGADGEGSVTARLGVVRSVGPEWHSSRGGRIDQRIVLDLRLGPRDEGGPVFDARGARLGISTLGPRGQALVIPAATVDRVVDVLLEKGRVARGWLGVALHPVAVPEALREGAGGSSGLMVMEIVPGGPAQKAGVVAGDILVALNGAGARRGRHFGMQLGAESVGREAELRVLRGGAVLSLKATIEARPAR